MSRSDASIYGFTIFAGVADEFIAEVQRRLADGEGGWILTLNLEMVSRAARNKEYAGMTRSAEIVIADGMPLVWASRKKRGCVRIPERITGSDVTARLLKLCSPEQVAVIGGVDPRKALRILDPNLEKAAYVFDGKVSLDPAEMAALGEVLRVRDSRLICIALGVPKQDVLADALRKILPKAMIIGVGGTFEMIAGDKKNGPQWMRNMGMEWLYRLLSEPRRLWRRYLIGYWPGVFALVGDVRRKPKKNAP